MGLPATGRRPRALSRVGESLSGAGTTFFVDRDRLIDPSSTLLLSMLEDGAGASSLGRLRAVAARSRSATPSTTRMIAMSVHMLPPDTPRGPTSRRC